MTTRLLMTADAVGGVWQYATDLARALQPHGVETTIAVLGPEPSEAQLGGLHLTSSPRTCSGVHRRAHDQAGVDAPQWMPEQVRHDGEGQLPIRVVSTGLPLDWLSSGPEPVLAAGRAVADLARDLQADIVHLNSPTLAAQARFDQPVVAVAHGCVATWWRAAHGTASDPGYAWQADLMREGLLAADSAVAPSAAFAADLQRTYALPATPLAIHNGRASMTSGEGASAAHAFTAGRLWDRVKNTAVLDRVAARLSVPLRAAGPVTGPHGETVAPKHLRLLGNLSADHIAVEFACSPVFISVTSFEPFGLAVLEAAQAGCALILSDIPTFRELWDGAALFVPAADDAAIAAAIEELIADPTRREALGNAARARAARYTPEATAAAIVALYARLLPARRAAA